MVHFYDILMMLLHNCLSFEKLQLTLHYKKSFFCFIEERKSTSGWVNDDRKGISGWNIPFKLNTVLGSDSESTRRHAGVGPGLLAAYTVQRMCQRNTTVGVQNVSCVYHNPTTWEDNMGWTCFLTHAAWATLLPVIRRLWETAHPSIINEFISKNTTYNNLFEYFSNGIIKHTNLIVN